jgi:hypothetical protein
MLACTQLIAMLAVGGNRLNTTAGLPHITSNWSLEFLGSAPIAYACLLAAVHLQALRMHTLIMPAAAAWAMRQRGTLVSLHQTAVKQAQRQCRLHGAHPLHNQSPATMLGLRVTGNLQQLLVLLQLPHLCCMPHDPYKERGAIRGC